MQGFRPELRVRRAIQTLALVAATIAGVPAIAAESYPSRPMRMISASAAGS